MDDVRSGELVASAPPKAPRSLSAWGWRLGTVLVTIAFIALWEFLPRAGLVAKIILPPFTDTLVALGTIISGPTFVHHFLVTLLEMVAGFLIGVAVGLAIGIPLAVWQPLKRLTYPLVIAFQTIPKIVLAPLVITWFGYGIESKIALAVLIAFFPVLINTMVGIESVPESAVKLMRSLRASRLQTFRKVSLPYAGPFIFAGIKTGLTFAVAGAIVAEFIGASEGLGYLLHGYSFRLKIDSVFAVIVILSVMGSVLYLAVDVIHRKLIFWRDPTLE
jgi:NitT/TauT family transport system permease protein